MTDTLGGILTNGLMGNGCTAMILGPFRLKVFIKVTDAVTTKRPGGSGVAGPAPIHIPTGYDAPLQRDEPKKRVDIMVILGDKKIERTYVVTKARSERIVEIANFINKTFEQFSVTVSKMRRVMHEVKIRFKK